jgi:FAD/FMN-containing dehydrogenase
MDGHEVDRLRERVAGWVFVPGDAGYDHACRAWNAMVDHRPAVIVRPLDAREVARAIAFARDHGLEIGVRGGGHSVTGLSVPDDGLMIDLRAMAGARVGVEARTARVQGGALLGQLDRASQPFGLATTAGNVSHTGVGGLTLGGGMGWLARQHGLACDNVLSFQVVTADGEVLRASGSEHPDLYWALRGGGGNFGVVTEFQFRLHEVGTSALSVKRYVGLDDAPAAVRRWRDLIPGAPRQATLETWVGTAGDWPTLPRELRGIPLAYVSYVWVGDVDEGRRYLPALRSTGPAVHEQVDELTYVELQSRDDDQQGHRFRRFWKGHYLRELPDAAIDAYLDRGAEGGNGAAPLPSAALLSHGGAIRDTPDDVTAFSHRDTFVEYVAMARWDDPAEDETRMTGARRAAAAVAPFASGVYVNALADEGLEGVQRAYRAEKLARLTAVKDRYDPDNVFHLNHNIRPSAPVARTEAAAG